MFLAAVAVFLMVITFNLLVLCQHQQIVQCTAAAGCPRNGSIQPFYAQVRSDAACKNLQPFQTTSWSSAQGSLITAQGSLVCICSGRAASCSRVQVVHSLTCNRAGLAGASAGCNELSIALAMLCQSSCV
jgi:hypothetical protein